VVKVVVFNFWLSLSRCSPTRPDKLMENFSDRIEWLFEGTSNEIYGSFEAHFFVSIWM